jgi:hypothetical protein
MNRGQLPIPTCLQMTRFPLRRNSSSRSAKVCCCQHLVLVSLSIWATFLTLNYFFHYCSWSGYSLMLQRCLGQNLLSNLKLNCHLRSFYYCFAAFAELALVAKGSMGLEPSRCLSFSSIVCWLEEPVLVS